MSKPKKRIIGYFLAGDRPEESISTVGLSLEQNIEMINYQALTHLNLSFMLPSSITDEDVDYKIMNMSDEQVRRVINKCHENGVKCILSTIGGGEAVKFNPFTSKAKRQKLYDQIIMYLDEFGFDGIDMDLESGRGGAEYAKLLKELSDALKKRGKLLTMAVAYYIMDGLDAETLSLLDFVNVMAYDGDETGDRRSTYEWAIDHMKRDVYKSIPREKLNLGVPFYGYSNDGRSHWNCDYDYAKLIQMSTFPGKDDVRNNDTLDFPGSLNAFNGQDFRVEHNSEKTIRQKAEYVRESDLGGIMIWDITKDCLRPEDKQYALMDVITAVLVS
jgi:GH18 family chitinase